jgi:hypothetical protein
METTRDMFLRQREEVLLQQIKRIQSGLIGINGLIKRHVDEQATLAAKLNSYVQQLEECQVQRRTLAEATVLQESEPLTLDMSQPRQALDKRNGSQSRESMPLPSTPIRSPPQADHGVIGQFSATASGENGPDLVPFKGLSMMDDDSIDRGSNWTPMSGIFSSVSAPSPTSVSSPGRISSSYLCAIETDVDQYVYKGYSNGLVIREHLENNRDMSVFVSRQERVEVLFVDKEDGQLFVGFSDGIVRCFDLVSTDLLHDYVDMTGKIVGLEPAWNRFMAITSFTGRVHVVDRKLGPIEKHQLDCDQVAAACVVGKAKSQLLVLPVGRFPTIYDLMTGEPLTSIPSDLVMMPAFAQLWDNYFICTSTRRENDKKMSSSISVFEDKDTVKGQQPFCFNVRYEEGIIVALDHDQEGIYAVVKLMDDTRLLCYSMSTSDGMTLKWTSFIPFLGYVCGLSLLPFGVALTAMSDGNVYQTNINVNGPFTCNRCAAPFCRVNDLRTHASSCPVFSPKFVQ